MLHHIYTVLVSDHSKFAVLILAFNRPNLVAELLETLSPNDISSIYVSIDGPRNVGDFEKANEIMELLSKFQNQFKIIVRRSNVNLGCCLGVISGIDWFYSQEGNGGIVLEDDCFPKKGYFDFVRKSLDDTRLYDDVGMISAHNPLSKVDVENYKSRFVFINGWYMRSDVWKKLRHAFFEIKLPSRYLDTGQPRRLSEAIFWWATYMRARIGSHDTWDSIFYRAFSELGYVCLVPSSNMIVNKGFGVGATHTTDPKGTIFLDQGEKLASGLYSSKELDDLILKYYFKVKPHHCISPFYKVLRDLIKFRKFPNYEELISNSTSSILTFKKNVL